MNKRLTKEQLQANQITLDEGADQIRSIAEEIVRRVRNSDCSYGQVEDSLKQLIQTLYSVEAVNCLLKEDFIAKLRGQKAPDELQVEEQQISSTKWENVTFNGNTKTFVEHGDVYLEFNNQELSFLAVGQEQLFPKEEQNDV